MKKKKLLVLILTFTLMSTGCSKNESSKKAEKIVKESTTYEQIVETTTEYINETKPEVTTEEVEKIISETTNKVTEEIPTEIITEILTEPVTDRQTEPVTESQTEKINSFDNFAKNDNEQIKELYKQDFESFKAYSKAAFIKTVDFIFYGSEINGTTFNELTEEGKQMIYNEFKEMVVTINNYDPTIIPNLEEKYSMVVTFISEKYTSAIEAIKNKVGEEKYNAFIEKKDEISSIASDKAGEFGAKIKTYANDKYQGFRNNEN